MFSGWLQFTSNQTQIKENILQLVKAARDAEAGSRKFFPEQRLEDIKKKLVNAGRNSGQLTWFSDSL